MGSVRLLAAPGCGLAPEAVRGLAGRVRACKREVMLQWLVDDRIKLGAVRDRLLQITETVLGQR